MRFRFIAVTVLSMLVLLAALAPVEAAPQSRCKPNDRAVGCGSSIDFVREGCTVSFFGEFYVTPARNSDTVTMAKRGGPYTRYVNILVDGVFYDSIPFDLPTYYGAFPQGLPVTYTFDEPISGDITAVVSGKPDDKYWFAQVDLPDDLGTNCSSPATDCPYPLPAGAVQARVLFSTPAYYAPSLDAQMSPAMILPVGESWWVIGAQDGFYHLFITCAARYIWVPAESLGANFDIVWNGAALPDAGTPAP
ncbi:MAG: hypothetical protein U0670_17605 [Anaerolineae bacterium]